MRYLGETAGDVVASGRDQSRAGVWLCPIGEPVSVNVDDRCQSVLSAQERRRLSGFRFQAHRREYLHSHYFLRRILSKEVKADPAQLRFAADEFGKPWLDGQCLNFNLSHTAGVAACTVSTGHVCGVDVERRKPLPDMAPVVARNFSLAERALIEGTTPSAREALFFRIWTLKEAYIKARGVGLSADLTAFSVLPLGNGVGDLRLATPTTSRTEKWSLYWWDFADAVHVAVAFEGDVPRPRITFIHLDELVAGGCHEEAH